MGYSFTMGWYGYHPLPENQCLFQDVPLLNRCWDIYLFYRQRVTFIRRTRPVDDHANFLFLVLIGCLAAAFLFLIGGILFSIKKIRPEAI